MSAILVDKNQSKQQDREVVKIFTSIRSYHQSKVSLSFMDLAGVKPYQPKKDERSGATKT